MNFGKLKPQINADERRSMTANARCPALTQNLGYWQSADPAILHAPPDAIRAKHGTKSASYILVSLEFGLWTLDSALSTLHSTFGCLWTLDSGYE